MKVQFILQLTFNVRFYIDSQSAVLLSSEMNILYKWLPHLSRVFQLKILNSTSNYAIIATNGYDGRLKLWRWNKGSLSTYKVLI